MIKFAVFLFLGYFLQTVNAQAYEFAHINKLFDTIDKEYSENADFKTMSLNSLKIIPEFDNRIQIYHSDSKVFLYIDNQLTKQFTLPQVAQNLPEWKTVLTDILETSLAYSSKLKRHPNTLEKKVLSALVAELDGYSRLEAEKAVVEPVSFEVKDNILYLHLKNFYPHVAQDIKKIIQETPQTDGLILDLRKNNGGSFNEAIKTADLFLEDVLITSSEEKKRRHYYTATAEAIYPDKPIIVLTNRFTASAAELLAAALSEQSRAVLVGTKTYGKSSIQNTQDFDGKTLFITSGHFFTPSGKSINNQGLTPQVCTGVNNSCTDVDTTNPDKDIFIAMNLIKKTLS